MPGISFLFKKRFHPARIDQQKKLFIAEQSIADRRRSEEERSQEVKKELDIQSYAQIDHDRRQGGNQDPRYADLKFMYAQPVCTVDGKKKELSTSNPFIGEEDDEAVQKFKMQMRRATEGPSSSADYELEDDIPDSSNDFSDQRKARNSAVKSNPNFSARNSQSALEKAVGKRRHEGQTLDEQQERFAFLKGAPVEGSYAQNIQLRHKPFNGVVRNVQCLRCGEWGHQSGDRECSLKDNNPHDFARQRREDPLTYMQSADFLQEKQRAILRTAASSSSSSTSAPATSSGTTNIWNASAPKSFVPDDEPESDPEADFIATLSRRSIVLFPTRFSTRGATLEFCTPLIKKGTT
jgi:CBF1 interacting corepressor